MAANPKIDQPLAVASDPAVQSVRVVAALGPREAAAEPPWPDFPPDREVRWERFMRFFGPLEAHIVAGRLNVEGVPTIVLTALGFEFPDNAVILVPRSLLHRARWVLAWPPMPDDELLYLATGEIGSVD